jgi:hypothetical protein
MPVSSNRSCSPAATRTTYMYCVPTRYLLGSTGSCFAPGAEFLNKRKREREGEKKDPAADNINQHDEPPSLRYYRRRSVERVEERPQNTKRYRRVAEQQIAKAISLES